MGLQMEEFLQQQQQKFDYTVLTRFFELKIR